MKIKLIIWDLDETLWGGTLSEEGIRVIPERAALIEKLSFRGIVNSICSKNDFEEAKAQLEKMFLWQHFVFPSINWQPKGQRIKELIEAAQLKAVNVLFLDDNHLNREEAKFYNPDLHVMDPEDPNFMSFMDEVLESGKDDSELSRLKQYKILEEKQTLSSQFSSNNDFLRSSNIRVRIIDQPTEHGDRIHELISRTNQLNYTKRRCSRAEVEQLLYDPDVKNYAISAEDHFGDYGLTGFVAVRDGHFEHFVFSCRLLNMGIESFVYHHFNKLPLEIVGDVSTKLSETAPDWINLVGVSDKPSAMQVEQISDKDILIIGGCDLEQACSYLVTSDRVETYFNYPSKDGKLVIHRDSIDYLLSDHLSMEEKNFVIRTVPFIDEKCFDVPDFSKYRLIVYSPLIDFIQEKYASEAVPNYFSSGNPFFKEPLTEERALKYKQMCGVSVDRQWLFVSHWRHVEKSKECYKTQLQKLFNRFCVRADRAIVLLGAEETYSDLDRERIPKHKAYNNLLREVARDFPKVLPIEVSNFLLSRDDFTNNIRHYQRHVYYRIAEEIVAHIS